MSRVKSTELRWRTGLRSVYAAARGVFRNVLFLFAAHPKTALRVMCIMALDTLHIQRQGQPLSRGTRQRLAALLDYGASMNAKLDGKTAWSPEPAAMRSEQETGDAQTWMADYTRRLATLESARPQPGGDATNFAAVRTYRESVVRLSLAMLATAGGISNSFEEAIHSIGTDPDFDSLFRVVMLCQIIDDVLDYAIDQPVNLPSFATACRQLPHALGLTRSAACHYARVPGGTVRAMPFRGAIWTTYACARATILLRLVLGAPTVMEKESGRLLRAR